MLKRCLIAAAVLSIAAGPATAGPRRTVAIARVDVADLNLSSTGGARALLHRLDAAARELCAHTPSLLLPRAAGHAWRCRQDALAQAVARMGTREVRLAYAELLTAEPSATP